MCPLIEIFIAFVTNFLPIIKSFSLIISNNERKDGVQRPYLPHMDKNIYFTQSVSTQVLGAIKMRQNWAGKITWINWASKIKLRKTLAGRGGWAGIQYRLFLTELGVKWADANRTQSYFLGPSFIGNICYPPAIFSCTVPIQLLL